MHQENKRVFFFSNTLTLRGFASCYFCDRHISFLLPPRALSNFFCCGINMEFFVKTQLPGPLEILQTQTYRLCISLSLALK